MERWFRLPFYSKSKLVCSIWRTLLLLVTGAHDYYMYSPHLKIQFYLSFIRNRMSVLFERRFGLSQSFLDSTWKDIFDCRLASLGKTFLLGVLFEIKYLCSGWPHIVSYHFSFQCTCYAFFWNMSSDIKFTEYIFFCLTYWIPTTTKCLIFFFFFFFFFFFIYLFII